MLKKPTIKDCSFLAEVIIKNCPRLKNECCTFDNVLTSIFDFKSRV